MWMIRSKLHFFHPKKTRQCILKALWLALFANKKKVCDNLNLLPIYLSGVQPSGYYHLCSHQATKCVCYRSTFKHKHGGKKATIVFLKKTWNVNQVDFSKKSSRCSMMTGTQLQKVTWEEFRKRARERERTYPCSWNAKLKNARPQEREKNTERQREREKEKIL